MPYPESPHPFELASDVYTYTVPSWPGGLHTVYITFSLDTYFDQFDYGTLTVATDSTTADYKRATLAGNTLALPSTNGVITFTLINGGDGGYGFRIMEIVLANPTYMIGNPNSEDNPIFDGDPAPGIVNTALDTSPLTLLTGPVGVFYTYPMKFLANATQTWSVSAGSLPAGLSLNATTGVISGTPTSAEEAHFTIQVVSGIPSTTTQAFVIVIVLAPIPVDTTGISFASGSQTGNSQFHFHHGGAWYLMADTQDFPHNLHIYKSTDEGLTWAALDVANGPPTPTGSAWPGPYVIGQVWDGANTIYCCYLTNWTPSNTALGTPATIALKKFDLTTDTWQASFGGTTTIIDAPGMSLVVLTTGVIRMLFFNSATGAIGEVISLYYMDNNGTAFTSPVVVVNGSAIQSGGFIDLDSVTHQPLSFVGGGVVDVCHIWYEVAFSTKYYIRLDGAGSASASFTVPLADYIPGFGGTFLGNALFEPATDTLVKPFVGPSVFSPFSGQPMVYRGTPLSAPVWTKEFVYPANPLDHMNASVVSSYASLFRAFDGREACIFAGSHNPEDAGDFTSYFLCYYDPAHPELKWTAREELYSCFTNPYQQQNIGFAPLDETPYWAEAKPGGGFYFAFTGDTQAASPGVHADLYTSRAESAGTDSSLNVKPAGGAAGDYAIVAMLSTSNFNYTFTSGWTLLLDTFNGTNDLLRVFGKRLVALDFSIGMTLTPVSPPGAGEPWLLEMVVADAPGGTDLRTIGGESVGNFTYTVTGTTDSGEAIPPGPYFVAPQAGDTLVYLGTGYAVGPPAPPVAMNVSLSAGSLVSAFPGTFATFFGSYLQLLINRETAASVGEASVTTTVTTNNGTAAAVAAIGTPSLFRWTVFVLLFPASPVPPVHPVPEIVTLYAWVPNILDQTMPGFNLPPQFSSDPSSPPERRIIGAIDGTNPTFTLTTTGLVTTVMLCRNGDMLSSGFDYTLSGNVITFVPWNCPVSGDLLTAAVFTE